MHRLILLYLISGFSLTGPLDYCKQLIPMWGAGYESQCTGYEISILDLVGVQEGWCNCPGEYDDALGSLFYIPSGTFTQGSTDDPCRDSSETPFTHTLTRDILVMETEVSRQMWADLKVVQPTLSLDPTLTAYGGGMDNPVQNNTWHEAVLFANLLSVERVLTRCYYKDASFTIPLDSSNYYFGSSYCNFDASGYRLPSEGEWEYLTRAGTTGPFSIDEPNYNAGNCFDCTTGIFPNLETVAVFCGNNPPEGGSIPVGGKNSNLWGLKDVHGNVWEWCWDVFSTYPDGNMTDYTGPTDEFPARVVRGGSHTNGNTVKQCRSAERGSWDRRSFNLGFRLVRTFP